MLSHLNRRILVTLGIFAGLRKGEIAGLQWESVDFEKSVIFVRHSLSKYDGLKEPKTAASNRTIYITPPIKDALIGLARYWMARESLDLRFVEGSKNTHARRIQSVLSSMSDDVDLKSMSGFVLRTCGGRAYDVNNVYEGLWIGAMRNAGLIVNGKCKFSIHAMRHAAASLFIGEGLSSFRLKHAIGHRNEATTYGVYGHLFPEDGHIRTAAEAIASRFDATQTRLKTVRA